MAIAARIRHRLRELLRSERGMALPTAIFAMIASMGLAGVAVLSSIDAQHGTKRDRSSKAAIAAADAGAGVALLRLNRFTSQLSEANPCVGPSGESLTPSGGWCPPTEPESVGDASFSYMVSAYQEDAPLSVVAVGTADGVSRRIEVGLVSYNGKAVFADERVVGQDDVTLEGTADIYSDVGTNGSITITGNAKICGNVRHGTGESAPEPDCDGDVEEGDRDLPPVTLPPDIATNNSNCRLALTCADPSEVDTYSKNRDSTRPWDAATRTINVSQNATLTMGGSDYFVCRLVVQNGKLIMADGANVRIFFDTPENCGLSDGDVQVSITGNANIISTGYKPSAGNHSVPGLYLPGSPDITTRVDLSGNSGVNELVLYAPNSEVEISGTADWIGMFAGKSLRLNGTPSVKSDPGMEPPDIVYESLWERTRYVECTGAQATPPDANC